MKPPFDSVSLGLHVKADVDATERRCCVFVVSFMAPASFQLGKQLANSLHIQWCVIDPGSAKASLAREPTEEGSAVCNMSAARRGVM